MNIIDISTVREQTIEAGGYIVFDTTNVRRGFAILHVDGTPATLIYPKGVYIVTFNADVVPTGAGEITVTLENNGVALNSATFTGVAGIGENIAFSYPVSVLKSCECVDNHANLKVSVSADATVLNANLMVIRKDN